jgi:uncharacterized protein
MNYLVSESQKYSSDLMHKLERLNNYLCGKIKQGIIVAYSGGTDSAMLLWAAKKISDFVGGKFIAVTQESESMSRKNLEEAIQFAKKIGAEHKIIHSNEFSDANYIKNDLNRCYYCRKHLFSITANLMGEEYKTVIYGYNHSDKGEIRPGHRAAIESGIEAPLALFEFSKEEIREVLRNNKIYIADKPSDTCLSTRIMTGIKIEKTDIGNIEELENIMWNAGAKIFRIRVCESNGEKFLRIEITPEEIIFAVEQKDLLVSRGKAMGYKWITLDLEGYKRGGGRA